MITRVYMLNFSVLVAFLSVHRSSAFSQSRLQGLKFPAPFRYRLFATEADIETISNKSLAPDDIDDEDETPLVILTKNSLYDILRAQRNATRAELKKQYITLARETHPDALIGTNISIDTAASFSEVAEAWKILSNPKNRRRYDRSLQTKAFAGDLEEIAGIVTDAAAPSVMKIFEKLAVPFLRRTAVTAVASFSAAAGDIIKSNGTKVDIGHAVSMAIKAGEAAGRIVDGMEMTEKEKGRAQRELMRKEKAQVRKANISTGAEVEQSKVPKGTDDPRVSLAATEVNTLPNGDQEAKPKVKRASWRDDLVPSTPNKETRKEDESIMENVDSVSKYSPTVAETTISSVKGKLASVISELVNLTSADETTLYTERALKVQAELLKVIDELVVPTFIDEPSDVDQTERVIEVHDKLMKLIYELVDETERAMEIQAKLSAVIDELVKSTLATDKAASGNVVAVRPKVRRKVAAADKSLVANETGRIIDLQTELSAVIDELMCTVPEDGSTAVDETQRVKEVQDKFSDVIDDLIKSTET